MHVLFITRSERKRGLHKISSQVCFLVTFFITYLFVEYRRCGKIANAERHVTDQVKQAVDCPTKHFLTDNNRPILPKNIKRVTIKHNNENLGTKCSEIGTGAVSDEVKHVY